MLQNIRIINKFPLIRNFSNYETISNILKDGQVGKDVLIKGWVKSLRKQKHLTFVDVNDGTTSKNLQMIVEDKPSSKISVGSSIHASGRLTISPKGLNEVLGKEIILIGECDLEKGYPFAPRKHYAPEYIREYLHLRPRTRKFSSVLRTRHAAILAMYNYLDQKGYVCIQTPCFTSNDCEGAGEVFKVIPDNDILLKKMAKVDVDVQNGYFDKKAFLSVSGQLHLEAAVHSLNKVYCFGPTFRAENSQSRFHLSEFYMLELEKAFLDNLDDLLSITENLIKTVTKQLLDKYADDILICTEGKVDFTWADKQFQCISYLEAVDILKNKLHKQINPNGGFSKEYELLLTEYCGNVPVFIINWPKEEKPFYVKEISNSTVAAFDLLAPKIGELVGGSLREDNYEKLKSRISSENSNLEWYLELRKFGGVPTGGFGLGFERYIQLILGIDNIKDSIPFPRWPHNCDL